MKNESNEAIKGQLIVEMTQKQELYFREASQIKRQIAEHNAARQTLRQQMGYAQREQMYFFEYQEFISMRIKEVCDQLQILEEKEKATEDVEKYISALSEEVNMLGSNLEARMAKHHMELEDFKVEKKAIQ